MSVANLDGHVTIDSRSGRADMREEVSSINFAESTSHAFIREKAPLLQVAAHALVINRIHQSHGFACVRLALWLKLRARAEPDIFLSSTLKDPQCFWYSSAVFVSLSAC
jgi:hypothetical protein